MLGDKNTRRNEPSSSLLLLPFRPPCGQSRDAAAAAVICAAWWRLPRLPPSPRPYVGSLQTMPQRLLLLPESSLWDWSPHNSVQLLFFLLLLLHHRPLLCLGVYTHWGGFRCCSIRIIRDEMTYIQSQADKVRRKFFPLLIRATKVTKEKLMDWAHVRTRYRRAFGPFLAVLMYWEPTGKKPFAIQITYGSKSRAYQFQYFCAISPIVPKRALHPSTWDLFVNPK